MIRKLLHLAKLGWSYRVGKKTVLGYPPYQFTIEPTNMCNLACDFCPQSDPRHFDLRPRGRLTVENFRLFLERVKASGTTNRNLNLTLDGEPFNNPHFPEFIEMAINEGFFPVFASNGTLFSRKKADRLAAAGPFRASIDFASDEKIYESIRGQTGHFELVRKNLTCLMELAKEYKGIHIDVHDITPFSGVNPEESLKKMRSLFPDDIPDRITFDSRQFHNFCGHLDAKNRHDTYRLCPYPWTQMAVTHSGDVVPCCRDTAGRSVMGNVFRDSVDKVWNGVAYQKLRQNLIDRRPDLNPACKNCDLPHSGGQPRWKIRYIFKSLLKR